MSVNFSIPPGIEKRVAAWSELTMRWAREKKSAKPCITLSREFGCQAYPLAETLHHRLNDPDTDGGTWALIDRLLLEKIAEQSGYTKSELEYITEVNPTFQSMITTLMSRDHAEPFEVFTYIKNMVRRFAKAGNSIIVGRGAVALTADLSNVFHVRLVAPMDFKAGIIAGYLGISEPQAREYIEKKQKERDEFIRHFTGIDLSAPHLYHMLLNNEKLSIDDMADIVIARVGKDSGP